MVFAVAVIGVIQLVEYNGQYSELAGPSETLAE